MRSSSSTRQTLAVVAVTLVCACSAPPEEVDWLLYGGRVITLDDDGSIHTAIALDGGLIVAVGGDDLRSRYDPRNELDLAGRAVIPGFIDSHTHIEGRPERYVHLPELDSIEEMVRRVAERAASLGAGEWVTGYGWSEDELAEGRRPLRADLDRAAPNNPVVLTRAGGHSAVANSLALELGGLDRDSPDPENGVLERDDNGELNGIIRERQDVLTRLVPRADPEELRASFVTNLRDLFRHGITSLVQASSNIRAYEFWESVYVEHRGTLPRAAVQLRWQGEEEMAAFGKRTGDGDEHLRVGAIKIFVDGGFTGPAAFTKEPYVGQADYRGKLSLTPEELRTTIRDAHEAGWQLGIHAIGDAAIELTVETLIAALEDAPRDDHRHYLNHFTMRPSDETMIAMADHGIAITQQPNFTYTLEGRYVANLDGARLEHNNPLRSPIDHGVFVALSSDILPIGPAVGLYGAVTRKGMSGRVFAESERLSVEEALRAYTRNGAYLTFEEGSKGTLEVGRAADLVILAQDPLAMAPDALLGLDVDATFLGGRMVYERAGFLSGEVGLLGDSLPEPTQILNTTDPEVCGRLHELEDLVVDPETRGVRDVVAILRPLSEIVGAPVRAPPLRSPFLLDNRGCRFVPHASVAPVGTILEATNSDDVLHTVHLYGPQEKNLALAIKGFRTRLTLEGPGLYVVRCDVHGWMQAFIRVVEEPYYAMSDESGRFRIDGAPPGDYTLELWHERLGTLETTVHIAHDEVSTVRIDYSPEIE